MSGVFKSSLRITFGREASLHVSLEKDSCILLITSVSSVGFNTSLIM